MKRIALVLAVVAPLLGCHGLHVDWPAVAKCGMDIGSALVGTIGDILMADGPNDHTTIGDRAQDQLEQLALKYGASTVACVVNELVYDWLKHGTAATPERLAAAARGRDFLHRIGTKIERPGGSP